MRGGGFWPLWGFSAGLVLLIGLSGATAPAAAGMCPASTVPAGALLSKPGLFPALAAEAQGEARLCTPHAGFSLAPRAKMCVASTSCAESAS